MMPTGKEYGLRVTAPKKDGLYIKARFLSLVAMGFWGLPFGFIEHPSKTKHSVLKTLQRLKLLESNGFLADLETKNGLHGFFSLKKKAATMRANCGAWS